MKPINGASRVWKTLSSLQLTIALLALLMVIVVACTLAQQSLGTFGAVETYVRSVFVYWRPGGGPVKIPVFPGGGVIGLLLMANLIAAQLSRLELSWRKAGLWVVHLGLILLFVGEFATGLFQKESQMIIPESSSKNYVQSLREVELSLIDATDNDLDSVYAIPETLLARRRVVADAKLPFTVKIDKFERVPSPNSAEGGVDEARAQVELLKDGRSAGAWGLSSFDASARAFSQGGRTYRLSLRPARRYLPFSLTLKKFVHEVYPGTDIPKGFASHVTLNDPNGTGSRDVVISMNNPLRYSGLSFYQASYDKSETVSILQVVANPGRLLPYISCALIAAGLLLHFGLSLRRSSAGRA